MEWKPLLVGQLISVVLTVSGLVAGLLNERDWNVPMTLNVCGYAALSLWLPVYMVRYKPWKTKFLNTPWKYALVAACDAEANFCLIKAFEYTSFISIMVLDCLTVPWCMVISRFFMGARYHVTNYVGALLSFGGLLVLVYADTHGSGVKVQDKPPPNPLLGDALCLASNVLFAISSCSQEHFCKRGSEAQAGAESRGKEELVAASLEYVGFLGLFGVLIGTFQLLLLSERSTAASLFASDPAAVGLVASYALVLFGSYSLGCAMVILSSATLMTLSFMTSDIYSIVIGVFLFNNRFSSLYMVSPRTPPTSTPVPTATEMSKYSLLDPDTDTVSDTVPSEEPESPANVAATPLLVLRHPVARSDSLRLVT
mmetsp:Transcript_39772/g.64494  ORF Transcript_39772/g.64494 Transcript_39772/m.64494 type:complete len:369 (+) Transcript_39772:64-1170(+)